MGRFVRVQRGHSFKGIMVAYDIAIDGVTRGSVRDSQTVDLPIDEGSHIFCFVNHGVYQTPIMIPAGTDCPVIQPVTKLINSNKGDLVRAECIGTVPKTETAASGKEGKVYDVELKAYDYFVSDFVDNIVRIFSGNAIKERIENPKNPDRKLYLEVNSEGICLEYFLLERRQREIMTYEAMGLEPPKDAPSYFYTEFMRKAAKNAIEENCPEYYRDSYGYYHLREMSNIL